MMQHAQLKGGENRSIRDGILRFFISTKRALGISGFAWLLTLCLPCTFAVSCIEFDAVQTLDSCLSRKDVSGFAASLGSLAIGVSVCSVQNQTNQKNNFGIAATTPHEGLSNFVGRSPEQIVVALESNLQLVEASHGVCQHTQFSRDELCSMRLHDLLDLRMGMDQPPENLGDSINVQRFESPLIRKDGSRNPCRVSMCRGTLGNRDVWIVAIADLTQECILQSRLDQAQKFEALGRLATGLAHEVSTPMQSILGNFEFLQKCFEKLTTFSDCVGRMLDEPRTQGIHEWESIRSMRSELHYEFLRTQTACALNEAIESSQHVISVLHALRTASHPGTPQAVETDLQDLIESASVLARSRWAPHAEIKFDFANDLPLIKAFPVELHQVFVNLFVNAADAIAEKKTRGLTSPNQIVVQTMFEDWQAVVRFTDSGVGIPKPIQKNIFEPFFTTKRVGHGTGQGLAIAKHVVEVLHHGKIQLESDVNIGTTFTIWIPQQAQLDVTGNVESKQASSLPFSARSSLENFI